MTEERPVPYEETGSGGTESVEPLILEIRPAAPLIRWGEPLCGEVVVSGPEGHFLRSAHLVLQLPDFRDQDAVTVDFERVRLCGAVALPRSGRLTFPFRFEIPDRFLYRCEARLMASVVDLREALYREAVSVPVDVAGLIKLTADTAGEATGLTQIHCDVTPEQILLELRASRRRILPSDPAWSPQANKMLTGELRFPLPVFLKRLFLEWLQGTYFAHPPQHVRFLLKAEASGLTGTVEVNPVPTVLRPLFLAQKKIPYVIQLGREVEAVKRLKQLLTSLYPQREQGTDLMP